MPWLVGIVVFPISIWGALQFHGYTVALIDPNPASWYWWLLHPLVWLISWILLFLLGASVSATTILGLTAYWQSEIAKKILLNINSTLVPSASSAMQDIARTARVEVGKLFWFLPLSFLALVVSFIPLLWPIGLFLTSLFLGYQFFDISLDVIGLGFRQRLSYCLKNLLTILVYGSILSLVWGFFGFILSPIATAGAAWIIANDRNKTAQPG